MLDSVLTSRDVYVTTCHHSSGRCHLHATVGAAAGILLLSSSFFFFFFFFFLLSSFFFFFFSLCSCSSCMFVSFFSIFLIFSPLYPFLFNALGHHFMGNVECFVPIPGDAQGSTALSALIHALFETESVGIVRYACVTALCFLCIVFCIITCSTH